MTESSQARLERMVKNIAMSITHYEESDWYEELLREMNPDIDDLLVEAGFDPETDSWTNLDSHLLNLPSVGDYINHYVYDIRYVISSEHKYIGAELLLAGGGPNIWASTITMNVEGYWGTSKAQWGFSDNMGLDEYIGELYDMYH